MNDHNAENIKKLDEDIKKLDDDDDDSSSKNDDKFDL